MQIKLILLLAKISPWIAKHLINAFFSHKIKPVAEPITKNPGDAMNPAAIFGLLSILAPELAILEASEVAKIKALVLANVPNLVQQKILLDLLAGVDAAAKDGIAAV